MRTRSIAVVVILFALTGCYEYEEQPVVAQTPVPVPADNAPPADQMTGRSTGQADARPSHRGARQAAHNAIEGINERQRELEKALEDQD